MLTLQQKRLKELSQLHFSIFDIDFSLPADHLERQIKMYNLAGRAMLHELTEILDILFEEGLSFSPPDNIYPLIANAIFNNNINMVHYLINKGSPLFWDFNYEIHNSSSDRIRNKAQFNCALSLTVHLLNRFKQSNFPILELLLEHDQNYIFYQQDKYRNNIILSIARNKKNDLLSLFEEKGMDTHVNFVEPVILSCFLNNLPIVQHFVEKGISLDQQTIIIEYCAEKNFLSFLNYFLSVGFSSEWMEKLSMNPQDPQFEKIKPTTKELLITLFNNRKLQQLLLNELSEKDSLPQVKI